MKVAGEARSLGSGYGELIAREERAWREKRSHGTGKPM